MFESKDFSCGQKCIKNKFHFYLKTISSAVKMFKNRNVFCSDIKCINIY